MIGCKHFYTDGSAPDNQNGCTQGGIGIAVFDADHQLIASYKETIRVFGETTTNVRCEMLALITGLKLSNGNDVIHTDSRMLVDSINKWLEGWKAKGWRNSSGKVKNLDLWLQVDELLQQKPDVTVEWVKGHDGIEGNELADRLATEAAQGLL